MTPDPIIASIPYSGTRFLKERLGVDDHVHFTLDWGRVWGNTEGRSIIVPLRQPVEMWRSWCRRHDPKNFPYEQWFLAWGKLHALDQMTDLDVICVDKQDDHRITDWSKVGHDDNSRADWQLKKVDLREVYALPIVHRHYGNQALREQAA